jgi:alpha-tubulin suppressor-like RCC1 family protein
MLEISAGKRHSLFLTTKGKVFGCGEGQRGQLGLGNYKNEIYPKELGIIAEEI